MTIVPRKNVKILAALAALAAGSTAGFSAMVSHAANIEPAAQAPAPHEPSGDAGSSVRIDRSGRKQVGKASFYAERYSGRTMADGTPMKLYSNNAASLTLPLGTTATVKNLETGKSAVITIRDRGPYVKGRIIDLSPATAKLIGISKSQGLASVEVTPIAFPGSPADAKIASLVNR